MDFLGGLAIGIIAPSVLLITLLVMLKGHEQARWMVGIIGGFVAIATILGGIAIMPATSEASPDAIPTSGWITANGMVYKSADAPTFVATVTGDQTTKYFPGQRLRLTQTTVKYFIVTKVALVSSNTDITMYGGTDYTLVNAAITSPGYSVVKAPAGFPLDPDKWTESLNSNFDTLTTNVLTALEDSSTPIVFNIPIGAWIIDVKTHYAIAGSKSGGGILGAKATVGLSADNSDFDSDDLIEQILITNSPNTVTDTLGLWHTTHLTTQRSVTTNTPYYPLVNFDVTGTPDTKSFSDNNYVAEGLIIKAVCAYL